jgi:nicotinamide-nucleotide amidase
MDVALINIGSELLQGFVLNTNAQRIAQKLYDLGMRLCLQLSIPDEEQALFAALSYASKHASFIVTTGGIGPTLDDLTVEFVQKWVEKQEEKSYHFPSLKEKICREQESTKKEELQEENMRLSFLPNSLGMCRGVIFHLQDLQIACLPGVPYEMEQMLKEQILPSLHEVKKGKAEMLDLFGLKEKQVDPFLRVLRKRYPKVEIGIYPRFTTLSIRFFVQEAKDITQLHLCKKELEEEFASSLMPDCQGKIERGVYLTLASLGKTVAVAESCTGGKVASLLALQPGVSSVFAGGVVAYSNKVKEAVLGVCGQSIYRYGAVSEKVAIEMARGVKQHCSSSLGISTTGIAGPAGGSEEKPVGTVWVGYSLDDGREGAYCFHTRGERSFIIERSSVLALSLLYSLLHTPSKPPNEWL